MMSSTMPTSTPIDRSADRGIHHPMHRRTNGSVIHDTHETAMRLLASSFIANGQCTWLVKAHLIR